MAPTLQTPRLTVRGWRIEDAPAALEIYGNPDVARWLSPAMDRVTDLAAMGAVLEQWIADDDTAQPPIGRWAIERKLGRSRCRWRCAVAVAAAGRGPGDRMAVAARDVG